MLRTVERTLVVAAAVLILNPASLVQAQGAAKPKPPVRAQSPGGLGFDLFGGAGMNWPGAKDSFEAVDLRANPIDIGGGARLVGLWKGMFLQVAGSRWSDTGDRAFIDSAGTRFSLGIPLDVTAMFIDGTIGLQRPLGKRRNPYILSFGIGGGVVRYTERSPFAEPGEDLEVSKPSYHAVAGLEVPMTTRLAAIVDAKYRHVPDLLGEGGVSAALGEDMFGGVNLSVGVRVGFGRRPFAGPVVSTKPGAQTTKPGGAGKLPGDVQASTDATILEGAPAYTLPDATRTPLATLERGVRVKVVQKKGDWLQIEFNDPKAGARTGWILSRFVRVPQK